MCKTYNGYTNYETWNVSLWIDNDPGFYAMVEEQADEYLSDAIRDNDNEEEAERDAIYNLSDWLENLIKDEYYPDNMGTGMYADLLGAALSKVNWYEIASNWIETVKDNI
jgi:hypothetical protein